MTAMPVAEGRETRLMKGEPIPETMHAVPIQGYNSPGWGPVERPVPAVLPDRYLVKVRAASINAADIHEVRGGLVTRAFSGFKKSTNPATGADVAGVVVAVGAETTKFKVGDEVFGGARGSLAEYGSAKTLARKPANLTWEEAAAIPIAGLTALQGLRDKGNLHPGQAVLVNGAAGGVGTFTVQIAKTLGAEVTAVCGTRNVDLVRSLGADHVVDYTKEDFATSHKKYDVVFDVVGNRSLGALRRLAKPEGTVVLCGGGHQKGHGQSLLLTISRIGRAAILAKISKKPRMVFFIAKFNDDDLATLGDMAELGTLKPAVERAYTLDQAAEAFRYLKSGHVQAKLVFTVSGG